MNHLTGVPRLQLNLKLSILHCQADMSNKREKLNISEVITKSHLIEITRLIEMLQEANSMRTIFSHGKCSKGKIKIDG